MPTFLHKNFAVSVLQADLLAGGMTLVVAAEDAARFPVPAAGQAFAVVLANVDGTAEVVHVTGVAGASFTCLRGQEGTATRTWLAGTLVQHCFTAESILSSARLLPRGEWSGTVTYLPNDMVTRLGVSYVANAQSLNEVPPGAKWQALFTPGTLETALTWRGLWSSTTEYVIGALVEYQGLIWRASVAGTNNPPSGTSIYWDEFALGGRAAHQRPILGLAGLNNYTTPFDIPLVDGLRVTIVPGQTSTSASVTLKLGTQPARPLRAIAGVNLEIGALQEFRHYEFIYSAGTSEFIRLAAADTTEKKLADLLTKVTALEVTQADYNAWVAGGAKTQLTAATSANTTQDGLLAGLRTDLNAAVAVNTSQQTTINSHSQDIIGLQTASSNTNTAATALAARVTAIEQNYTRAVRKVFTGEFAVGTLGVYDVPPSTFSGATTDSTGKLIAFRHHGTQYQVNGVWISAPVG